MGDFKCETVEALLTARRRELAKQQRTLEARQKSGAADEGRSRASSAAAALWENELERTALSSRANLFPASGFTPRTATALGAQVQSEMRDALRDPTGHPLQDRPPDRHRHQMDQLLRWKEAEIVRDRVLKDWDRKQEDEKKAVPKEDE